MTAFPTFIWIKRIGKRTFPVICKRVGPTHNHGLTRSYIVAVWISGDGIPMLRHMRSVKNELLIPIEEYMRGGRH